MAIQQPLFTSSSIRIFSLSWDLLLFLYPDACYNYNYSYGLSAVVHIKTLFDPSPLSPRKSKPTLQLLNYSSIKRTILSTSESGDLSRRERLRSPTWGNRNMAGAGVSHDLWVGRGTCSEASHVIQKT
jgi:hypothetical protein